jgi:hypothetical protein
VKQSTLMKKQVKKYGPRADTKLVQDYGPEAQLTAEVRYDDSCGNGCNSFAVTGDIVTAASKRRRDIEAGGQLHDDIARLFPELAPTLPFHLTSSDGPMHYEANTLYWLGWSGWTNGKSGSPPNLEHARSTAVWPDMPASFVRGADSSVTKETVQHALRERLPATMTAFRSMVESLGFTY